jgi:DNA-binding NarL/FixJ family response regulator
VVNVRSRERAQHYNDEKKAESVSLTHRQLEVLQLLAEGASTAEISERLGISARTAENHLSAIFRKLDTTNRTMAVVKALSMGIVTIEYPTEKREGNRNGQEGTSDRR